MHIAYEDWILGRDPRNYDTELEFLLSEGVITYADCKEAFNSGDMTADEFNYCIDFFDK